MNDNINRFPPRQIYFTLIGLCYNYIQLTFPSCCPFSSSLPPQSEIFKFTEEWVKEIKRDSPGHNEKVLNFVLRVKRVM